MASKLDRKVLEIKRMYEQGIKEKVIARKIGCSPITFSLWINKRGFKRQWKNPAKDQ